MYKRAEYTVFMHIPAPEWPDSVCFGFNYGKKYSFVHNCRRHFTNGSGTLRRPFATLKRSLRCCLGSIVKFAFIMVSSCFPVFVCAGFGVSVFLSLKTKVYSTTRTGERYIILSFEGALLLHPPLKAWRFINLK